MCSVVCIRSVMQLLCAALYVFVQFAVQFVCTFHKLCIECVHDAL